MTKNWELLLKSTHQEKRIKNLELNIMGKKALKIRQFQLKIKETQLIQPKNQLLYQLLIVRFSLFQNQF